LTTDTKINNPYALKPKLRRVKEKIERQAIAEALAVTKGNRRKAAELLDISYRSILAKTKRYGFPGNWDK
jgi:DNA-binding NtrC family response regulator